jgi:hypothetical protein
MVSVAPSPTMSLHHLDPIGVLLALLVVVAYRRLRHR